MSKFIASWFLFGLLIWTPIFAKSYPFVLERGLFHSDLFDIGGQYNEIGFVFQNPARILGATPNDQISTAYSTKPDVSGYFQDTLMAYLSLDNIAFAAGGLLFFNPDVLSTSPRPYTDELTRLSGAVAIRCSPKLRVGLRGTQFNRQLNTDEVSYSAVDAGVYYDTQYKGLSVGAYTHNAIHSDYEWQSADSPEELRRQVVLEADYRFDHFNSRLSTDFDESRWLIQYLPSLPQSLTPIHLGFHGDIVADDDFSVSRYGVGASFGGYPFSDLSLIFIPGSDVNVQVVYWFHVIQVDQVETAHELGLRFSI